MLSLKKLQDQVFEEERVAEAIAGRRQTVALRAMTMRYEASPAGIATGLILSSLTRNVEGFPENFMFSTGLIAPGSSGSHADVRGSEWSLDNGVWRVVGIGDFDAWAEIRERSSTRFSMREMIDEILESVDMPGSDTAEEALVPYIRVLSGHADRAELSALLLSLPSHALAALNIRTTAMYVSRNLEAEHMEYLYEVVCERFVDQELPSEEVRDLVDELKAIGIAPEVALNIPVGILGLLTAVPPSPPLVAAQKKVSARKASGTKSRVAKPRAAKAR